MNKNKLQIRNSTAEFLIFTSQTSENTIEVRVQDETVWLTQQQIVDLLTSAHFKSFGISEAVTKFSQSLVGISNAFRF